MEKDIHSELADEPLNFERPLSQLYSCGRVKRVRDRDDTASNLVLVVDYEGPGSVSLVKDGRVNLHQSSACCLLNTGPGAFVALRS
jgi:hypothetical protein